MADAAPVFQPSVIYQDDRAALEWLAKAFGFEASLIVTTIPARSRTPR